MMAKDETTSRRRSLLVATDNFLPRHDGISRFLKEVLPVLAERYDVTVVCPDFGSVQYPGVSIVQLPLSRWRVGDYTIPQFAFGRVAALVTKADIVFAQGVGSIGWAAIRAARASRKKTVLYMHSIDWELVPKAVSNPFLKTVLPGLVKWFVRHQYARCDLVLVPSEGVAETLAWNHIKVEKEIVHLGVNTKEFIPPKDKAVAKEKLGISKDALVIGYHGRLAPEKDLKTLLRGFLRVGGCTLLVVGKGVPSIEDSLKRRDSILVGAQSDVVPYLQAMDIYVMPSLTETTCLSVLEAMSCGLPVVSTPVGYVRDYIENNENGYFFPKGDSYSLAKRIHGLAGDEKLRVRIGLAARTSIQTRFTWDKTRARIKEIFEKL
jgi:glycosyltransferase involved in cell wall biosynthesis